MRLTKIETNIYVVGTAKKLKTLDSEQIIMRNNLSETNLFSFKKLYKNKTLYTSELAQMDKKSESFY